MLACVGESLHITFKIIHYKDLHKTKIGKLEYLPQRSFRVKGTASPFQIKWICRLSRHVWRFGTQNNMVVFINTIIISLHHFSVAHFTMKKWCNKTVLAQMSPIHFQILLFRVGNLYSAMRAHDKAWQECHECMCIVNTFMNRIDCILKSNKRDLNKCSFRWVLLL